MADRKYFTEDEMKALLRVIESPRDKAIFTLAYWRGLRASEVSRLTLTSFDARKERLHVKRLKKSLEGTFLLSPAEMRAMKGWMKHRGDAPGPLFPSRQGRRGISRQMLDVLMRKYAEMAGVPEYLRHFHTLKHSIATHLMGKLDLGKVQQWLGHRDIKSTLEYAKIRNTEMDAAARQVYGDME